MQVPSANANPRFRGDGGSVLVEFALFSPVLFVILMAITELGVFFRSYITISAAIADGSRQASIYGNAIDADYQILQAVKKDFTGFNTTDIQVLVVFDPSVNTTSTAAYATAPSTCTQTSVATPISTTNQTSKCNAYTPTTDWTGAATQFACGTTANGVTYGSRSIGYCPTSRKTAVTSSNGNGPPDYVGIYVRFKHRYFTGMFGRTKTIEQTFITRIEPQALQ